MDLSPEVVQLHVDCVREHVTREEKDIDCHHDLRYILRSFLPVLLFPFTLMKTEYVVHG